MPTAAAAPQTSAFKARFISYEQVRPAIFVSCRYFEGLLKFDGPETQTELSFEYPRGEALDLSMSIQVPGIDKAAKLTADLAEVDGISFVQSSESYLIAHVDHSPNHDGNCTVVCSATEESRTGRGACIDCNTGTFKIRLCC